MKSIWETGSLSKRLTVKPSSGVRMVTVGLAISSTVKDVEATARPYAVVAVGRDGVGTGDRDQQFAGAR